MPTFENFPESHAVKMIYLGHTGCLAGNTVVHVRRGQSIKQITMEQLFSRCLETYKNGILRKKVDTFLLADLGGYVGQHKMVEIVKSGIKSTLQIVANGHSIIATPEHKFKTEAGWKPAADLEIGTLVEVQMDKVNASKTTEFKPIESIKEFGEVMTFDIVMEPPHNNFIANGFVVHNSGKTGSLTSLAAAGYTLRILDLDKGVEILSDYLSNPKSIYTQANPPHWTAEQASALLKRVSYVTLDEAMLVQGKNIIPRGDLWNKISDQLNSWRDGDQDLGNISTWGPETILVIDGMSRLAQAAFNFQLKMGGRLLTRPEQSDWGLAQNYVLRLLMLLYSSEVKCNVIVICHIAFIETEMGPIRGFPQTLGKALSPQVGQFFNHALLAKSNPDGKRVILTNTSGVIELKSASPLRVKKEYPLETGLADYFQDIKNRGVK